MKIETSVNKNSVFSVVIKKKLKNVFVVQILPDTMRVSKGETTRHCRAHYLF